MKHNNLAEKSIVTLNERREKLIETWERAFLVTLKKESNFRARLKELETWDTMNNEFERNCKIQALNNLLGR